MILIPYFFKEAKIFSEFLIDLIEIYIEVIHPQAPIIPLAQFQTNWNAVGHRTSLLSPAYRFLVQVMQVSFNFLFIDLKHYSQFFDVNFIRHSQLVTLISRR